MAGSPGGSGLKAMYLLLPVWLAPMVLAADEVGDPVVSHPDKEAIAALMEFVGGWEQAEGEWIDAMSLDVPQQQEGEANDESN